MTILTQPLISKRCNTCKEELPVDRFYLRSDTKKYRSDCKDCHNAKAANRWKSDESFRQRGKARSRAHALQTFYGITEAEYEQMYAKQNGSCAICGCTQPDTRFCVDHCHTTGAVRGLLCNDCNTTLGKFNDDIERFYKAIAYLQASKSSDS